MSIQHQVRSQAGARAASTVRWGLGHALPRAAIRGSSKRGDLHGRLIEASDGAADGRRKILNVARKSPKPPQLCGLFDAEELGLALGAENVIHTAFLAGRGADRWTNDVRRLSGFRPLLPESWREEKPPEAGGT